MYRVNKDWMNEQTETCMPKLPMLRAIPVKHKYRGKKALSI